MAYWIGWLLCMCVIFYYDNIEQYENAEKVEARVVEKLVGVRRRAAYRYPQFQFTYKDSSYLFAKSYGLFLATWHIGDKATAIFPKGEPDKAEVYSFLTYWVSLSKFVLGFFIASFLFVIPVFFRWYTEFKNGQR